MVGWVDVNEDYKLAHPHALAHLESSGMKTDLITIAQDLLRFLPSFRAYRFCRAVEWMGPGYGILQSHSYPQGRDLSMMNFECRSKIPQVSILHTLSLLCPFVVLLAIVSIGAQH